MSILETSIFIFSLLATFYLLLSLRRGFKNFFIVLFSAKPFIDQTVRKNLIKLGGTEINLLGIWGIILFGVVLYLFLSIGVDRKKQIKGKEIIWLFLLIHVFVAIVSIIFEKRNFIQITEALLRLFTPFFIYFIFPIFLTDDNFVKKLIKTLWYSNLVAMLLSLGIYLIGAGYIDISQNVNRFSGFYGDAASLSLAGFSAVVFAVLFRELNPKKMKGLLNIFYFITLFAYTLVFWITLTKATVLITLIFVILWWGIYKRKLIIIVPIIIIAVIYIYQSSQRVQSRFEKEVSFFSSIGENETSLYKARGMGSGRFGRWVDAIDIYEKDYSLFEKMFGTYMTFRSHNQFIAYLMQIGAVGLFVFLLLLFSLFRRLIYINLKSKNPTIFIGLILLASMVVYGSGYVSFSFTTFFWATMIFVSGINIRNVPSYFSKYTKKPFKPNFKKQFIR